MITDQKLTMPVMLEAICRHYKLSRKELADELGFNEETVGRWINGRSKIPEHMPDTLKGLELRLIGR